MKDPLYSYNYSYLDKKLHSYIQFVCTNYLNRVAARGNLIGCASAWYADGHGLDPHVR